MVHELRQLQKPRSSGSTCSNTYSAANDTLARTLVFLINDDKQSSTSFALLDKLRAKHGEDLNKYAQLTAALCVVQDRPFTRHINENKTVSPDAVAIYEYYTANEKRMLFPIKNVPAELLMCSSLMRPLPFRNCSGPALNHYAGDNAIGKHFFDIQYDEESFRKGTAKKVDAAGFNLPNILKYGGVCAGSRRRSLRWSLAKRSACRQPTYTTASSAEVGHAWVGFLQAPRLRRLRRRAGGSPTGYWNFDVGRYEEYRGVRGSDAKIPDAARISPIPTSRFSPR